MGEIYLILAVIPEPQSVDKNRLRFLICKLSTKKYKNDMETQKQTQEEMEYRVNSLKKDTISATIGEEKLRGTQITNDALEEEQKLLNEGGWVHKETKRESGWKLIPLYFHLLMIMFTIIIILQKIVTLNIPIIGEYVLDIIEIVEKNK